MSRTTGKGDGDGVTTEDSGPSLSWGGSRHGGREGACIVPESCATSHFSLTRLLVGRRDPKEESGHYPHPCRRAETPGRPCLSDVGAGGTGTEIRRKYSRFWTRGVKPG